MKSLDSIGQYGALELRRVFPLSCSNDTLLEVFVQTCLKNGFLITERTDDRASAIKEYHNMYEKQVACRKWFGLGSTAWFQVFHCSRPALVTLL